MTRFETVLAAIDAANAADPNVEDGQPAALLYGRRMSAELERLFPDAAGTLRIAARGQHVERWILPRGDYPQGREGYLSWRRDLAHHHAERVAGLMADAGYGAEDVAAVRRMLLKQGLKRDPLVQALEDVICMVFLKWYFAPFAEAQPADKIAGIVARTARKMSPEGRARVLREFDLPEPLAEAFRV